MENSFSNRIKELRTSLNLTQSEFAKEIGTTQATLSSYENSDKLPSVDILITISQKYHISVDWLCGLKAGSQTAIPMDTYSDLINILSIIGTAEKLNTNISIKEIYESDLKHHSSANISINDQTIIDFVSEWLDVLAICKKSPSGKKLYDIWIKDILERYDTPIKVNPSPTVEDLPFN